MCFVTIQRVKDGSVEDEVGSQPKATTLEEEILAKPFSPLL